MLARRFLAVTYRSGRDATYQYITNIREDTGAWPYIRDYLRCVEVDRTRTEPPLSEGTAALRPTVSKMAAFEALDVEDREYVRLYEEAVEMYSAPRVVVEVETDEW